MVIEKNIKNNQLKIINNQLIQSPTDKALSTGDNIYQLR